MVMTHAPTRVARAETDTCVVALADQGAGSLPLTDALPCCCAGRGLMVSPYRTVPCTTLCSLFA
jgi:hypothetical protein